jgi:hypothetical protein
MRDDELSESALESGLACCRTAHALNSFAVLTRGDALLAAVVLNRPDWLWDQGHTILSAMQKLGPEGVTLAYCVERRYYSTTG